MIVVSLSFFLQRWERVFTYLALKWHDSDYLLVLRLNGMNFVSWFSSHMIIIMVDHGIANLKANSVKFRLPQYRISTRSN